MTIREVHERYDSTTMAVYFSDLDELYMYSDVADDYDDYEIDTVMESLNVKLIIAVTHTPDDVKLKEFKQEFTDKMDAVARAMYNKYCNGKSCNSCFLDCSSVTKPCFMTKVNSAIYDAKKVINNYNKEEEKK